MTVLSLHCNTHTETTPVQYEKRYKESQTGTANHYSKILLADNFISGALLIHNPALGALTFICK